MNNVTKVLWEKYWGKNNDIESSTIFKLIDLYLAPISEGEKKNPLILQFLCLGLYQFYLVDIF